METAKKKGKKNLTAIPQVRGSSTPFTPVLPRAAGAWRLCHRRVLRWFSKQTEEIHLPLTSRFCGRLSFKSRRRFIPKIDGLRFTLLLAAILVSAASYGEAGPPASDVPKKFLSPPPPFTPGIYPCSQCHEGMPVNRKPRKLDQYHQEISLKHMPGGWCFDCHNPDNRDKLRLASGGVIPFEESYRLCGQCHGTVLRDWEVGLHGKRTGMWNGEKQYLLCAHCHWPHDPVFKPLAPMPAPVRPSAIKPMKQETQKSSNGGKE